MKILQFLLFVGCLYLPVAAFAHPVAYANSTSIMTWNEKTMSDWMLTHSFTSNYSLSARYYRLETLENQQIKERFFYIPHVNFLLKRFNELDSQANIYFSGGYGVEKEKQGTKGVSLFALEMDWESRKYYISFRQQALLPSTKNRDELYSTKVRGGFAPYLGKFEELNTWFILQVERNSQTMDEYTVTPLIRLYYKNILTETGVNQKGDMLFNFMVHF